LKQGVEVLTKSIRLTEQEAQDLEELVKSSGEVEASVLKRAALRGLRDERVDKAVLRYLNGASSSEAAALANVPRAKFLDLLAEKGITILDAPSSVPEELEAVAALFGDQRLADAAGRIRGRGPATQLAASARQMPVAARETARRRRPR
jgi:Arc/MetJ-type ribon-helix-helix transcriptional regulator